MGVLQRFERRLEGMVTGAFTRPQGRGPPVEIAAALQRELDNNAQIVTRERLWYQRLRHRVGLARPHSLAPYEDTLTAELLEPS